MTQNEAKGKIQELVAKYEQVKSSGKINSYTEQDTKDSFIRPMFEALGWDFDNRDEVSKEESINSAGRIDYGLYLNNHPKVFIEAKKLGADLHDPKHANQAINYCFNRVVTWAVLTDFESLKVFNAQNVSENLSNKLYFEIQYSDYLERFDQLWELSKESLETGLIEKEATRVGKLQQKITVTEQLAKDLNEIRDLLTHSLHSWNPTVSPTDIDEGVQKLLDRLIFLRVAEDRNIEEPILKQLIREYKNKINSGHKVELYESMIERFRELDDIYNSNLFSEHPFEKWQEYGKTEKAISILYGKEGYYEYDFKVIPSDVLGQVYENYLGHLLSKSRKGLTLDKSAKKRKEQGIYYTPSYIEDYIVEQALQPVLDKCKSIAELKSIKVLDPACGSGSFLIKALEMIEKKYVEFGARRGEGIRLQILLDNIYGVDLDDKAVEIARLNLVINSLEKRMKLPGLEHHIKNGNSLISGTEEELKKYFGKNYRDKKPFNWEEEFPEVFNRSNPGFDVVIGNPPWGATIDDDRLYLEKYYPNTSKSHKDTYKAFFELAINIMRNFGQLGLVTPSAYIYQPKDSDLRNFISKYQYSAINLGEKIFDNVQLPCGIIIFKKHKLSSSRITDLSSYDRSELENLLHKPLNSIAISTLNINKYKSTLDTYLELKDSGIQYHRSGIGLSNKGGNNLYERIFNNNDHYFANSMPTWYGKLLSKYFISDHTNEYFNLDYKNVLKPNESVSFNKLSFEQPEKIIWRQTASKPIAAIDTKKRWFRNTIQCGYIKDEYKKDLNIYFVLGVINSKAIEYFYKQLVLESNRVFPQVKITYLKKIPFVLGSKDRQNEIATLVKQMLALNEKIRKLIDGGNEFMRIKEEIERTDKKIDQLAYQLYGLSREEIKMVESALNKK